MLVPRSLRRWFTLDFILALVSGFPLLIAPEWSLQQLNWGCVDPWVTRILASAVIALGTQSLVHRGSSAIVCLAIIHQKCVWSLVASGAILGELWKQGWHESPWGAWLFLGLFIAFGGLWFSYWLRLSRALLNERPAALPATDS